jgi:hypothetical protein
MSDSDKRIYRVLYAVDTNGGGTRSLRRAPLCSDGSPEWLSIPPSLEQYPEQHCLYIAAAEQQFMRDLAHYGVSPLSTEGDVVFTTTMSGVNDSEKDVPVEVKWRGRLNTSVRASQASDTGTCLETDEHMAAVMTIDRRGGITISRDSLAASPVQHLAQLDDESDMRSVEWSLAEPKAMSSPKFMNFTSLFSLKADNSAHMTHDDHGAHESPAAKLAKMTLPYLDSAIRSSKGLAMTVTQGEVEQGGRHWLARFAWTAGEGGSTQKGTAEICVDHAWSFEEFRVHIDGVPENDQPRWKITGPKTLEQVGALCITESGA